MNDILMTFQSRSAKVDPANIYKQGSYTTGPSKFQDFSRTFKDHIYKNPGPVIARRTETIQTNQQTM